MLKNIACYTSNKGKKREGNLGARSKDALCCGVGLAALWLVYQQSFMLIDVFFPMRCDSQIAALLGFAVAFAAAAVLVCKFADAIGKRLSAKGMWAIAGVLLASGVAWGVTIAAGAAPLAAVVLFWAVFGAAAVAIGYAWFRHLSSLMFSHGPEYALALLFAAFAIARLASLVSSLAGVGMYWVVLCPAVSFCLYLIVSRQTSVPAPTYTGKLFGGSGNFPLAVILSILAVLLVLESVTDTYRAFSGQLGPSLVQSVVSLVFYIGAFALSFWQCVSKRSFSSRPLWFALFGCLIGVFLGMMISLDGQFDRHSSDLFLTAWSLAWSLEMMLMLLLVYERMAAPSVVFVLLFALPKLAVFVLKGLKIITHGAWLVPPVGVDVLDALRDIVVVLFPLALCAMIAVIGTSRAFNAFTGVGKDSWNSASRESEPASCDMAEICSEFRLTPRESEILQYLALGKSAKHIAEHCFVSPETVRSHTKRIYVKMGLHSRDGLMSLLDERGITSQLEIRRD